MEVNRNVNSNYGAGAYRQTRAAASSQRKETDAAATPALQTQEAQDTVEISAEGRACMMQQEENVPEGEGGVVAEAMSKEVLSLNPDIDKSQEWFDQINSKIQTGMQEFVEQLRKNPKNTVVPDSFHTVDPDGSLYNKAYWAAYAECLTAAVRHVEDYYADRMKEFSGMTVQEGMMHLRNKYIDSNSSIFCSGMSAAERAMSYKQELTLFLGGNVIIGDPYALKAHGGLLNVNEMDAYARKAAEDYLTSLLRNRNQAQVSLEENAKSEEFPRGSNIAKGIEV